MAFATDRCTAARNASADASAMIHAASEDTGGPDPGNVPRPPGAPPYGGQYSGDSASAAPGVVAV